MTPLTPTQTLVLDAIIATDGTSQAVADKLGMAVNTVRTHEQAIRRKLGVHTKTAAVVLKLQDKL